MKIQNFMTWTANMLWMKLTQLCISLKAFPKEEGAFVHVQILLFFYSKEWDSKKSFKPIINIYLNIQKTYSKHGFNKFLHTSNNFTVA